MGKLQSAESTVIKQQSVNSTKKDSVWRNGQQRRCKTVYRKKKVSWPFVHKVETQRKILAGTETFPFPSAVHKIPHKKTGKKKQQFYCRNHKWKKKVVGKEDRGGMEQAIKQNQPTNQPATQPPETPWRGRECFGSNKELPPSSNLARRKWCSQWGVGWGWWLGGGKRGCQGSVMLRWSEGEFFPSCAPQEEKDFSSPWIWFSAMVFQPVSNLRYTKT